MMGYSIQYLLFDYFADTRSMFYVKKEICEREVCYLQAVHD